MHGVNEGNERKGMVDMVAKTAAKPSANTPKPSARERLLAAANELFYREGVQTVGIDRIIEHAGVAKASLYNTYGSKEGLVGAYLKSRHARQMERVARTLTRFRTPRERLLGVFDAQGELFTDPEYHGCAFVRASAEAHDGDAIDQATRENRAWLRALFTELAAEAGAPDPETLARQLHLLYDGAGLSARMDRDPSAATAARSVAAILLDATLAASPAGSSVGSPVGSPAGSPDAP